jgi:hypothetical protein
MDTGRLVIFLTGFSYDVESIVGVYHLHQSMNGKD